MAARCARHGASSHGGSLEKVVVRLLCCIRIVWRRKDGERASKIESGAITLICTQLPVEAVCVTDIIPSPEGDTSELIPPHVG